MSGNVSKKSIIGKDVYKVTRNDLKDNYFEWFNAVSYVITL